jgi:GT2 family glycosyltransferase
MVVTGKASDRHIVSVVVPTMGRPSVERTRRALEVQTRPADEISIVEDPERRGPGWARNEGIRRTCGDLVAFTDDDTVPPPDWLERLVGAIDRHDAAVAGGTLQETDDLLRRKRLRRGEPGTEMVDEHGWAGNSGNIMFRRACLVACRESDGHVFNEEIPAGGGEDFELMARLRRRGAKVVFFPIPVVHLRTLSPAGYLSMQFRRGRAVAYLYRESRQGPHVPFQRSLLWGWGKDGRGAKWAAALWKKAVGPFDLSSFTGPGQFSVFWVGEKLEGAGFLYEMARGFLKGGDRRKGGDRG